jgi:hypothetical protein
MSKLIDAMARALQHDCDPGGPTAWTDWVQPSEAVLAAMRGDPGAMDEMVERALALGPEKEGDMHSLIDAALTVEP